MKVKIRKKKVSVGPLSITAELDKDSAKCTISRGNKNLQAYSESKLKEGSNE